MSELLPTIAERILMAVDHIPVSLHIFADKHVYRDLRRSFRERMRSLGRGEFVIHDPREAASYKVPERSTSINDEPGYLENPFLKWINDSLGRSSADVVHFVCHGYLSPLQGALAFAESPTINKDQRLARFVGPQELTTFLTAVGAESAFFSSPIPNFSISGLRFLADQVARSRPGPILLHELHGDGNAESLAQAYRFLYNGGEGVPIASPTVTLYCHPNRLRQFAERQPEAAQMDALNQYTLTTGDTLKVLESVEPTPSWVASSQRFLEQSTAIMLQETPVVSSGAAVHQGAQEAMEYLSGLVGRHVSAISASESATSDIKHEP
jgi:hypothetical protein